MQIDSRNFDQHYHKILHEIEQSHFIAFDCQFTGLVTQNVQIEGLFPNHVQFYERIKETALNFRLLQLGLTIFTFQGEKYVPVSYNIYLIPLSYHENYREVMVCETESMQFLAKHNMDFTHVFQYGISSKRLKCKEIKKKELGFKIEKDNVFFCFSDQKIIHDIEQRALKQKGIQRIDFKSKKIFDFFKDKYSMTLDKGKKKDLDRYEYNVKFYEVHQTKDKISEKEEKDEQIKKEIIEIKQEVNLQNENTKQSPASIEGLINQIITHKIPIVGHFPNLDLGLIYHSFIQPLPETFQQFTTNMNNMFPYIFDTKVISIRIQQHIKGVRVDLKSLYMACFNPKLFQLYTNINFKFVEDYLKAQSSHQAGYDSFMTGCAFVGMSNFLIGNKGKNAINFNQLEKQNKWLYSKFTKEVSLIPPNFCAKTPQYTKRIVICPKVKTQHQWQIFATELSKYGTLSVHENQEETYYVFENDQDIQQILDRADCKQLKIKGYGQRRIVKCRNMYR